MADGGWRVSYSPKGAPTDIEWVPGDCEEVVPYGVIVLVKDALEILHAAFPSRSSFSSWEVSSAADAPLKLMGSALSAVLVSGVLPGLSSNGTREMWWLRGKEENQEEGSGSR